MLRIRFLRVGKKNSPRFRLIVTERRSSPKTGNFLEILGSYNPIQHTKNFKQERIQYWISKGAKESDTVHNILIREGIIQGAKVALHKKLKEAKKEVKTKVDSAT